jgi:Holliday junction resolvasome RuvABC DNA-binding subunit
VLNWALFLASCAILYYVVRYRVHVHIEFSDSPSRQRVKKGRRAERSESTPTTATAMTRPDPSNDLSSALVNLGAKPHRARAAAQHVVRNWPDAGFDEQLRAALKEVA